VPHVTNNGLSFGSETPPRPRCTELPVPVASWTQTDVSVVAQRHALMAMAAFCTAARPSVAGTRPSVGLWLTMPAQPIVRNLITRKPNVYLTRVNAGGDGASGPYLEREPA
jgi:hypothetical protein